MSTDELFQNNNLPTFASALNRCCSEAQRRKSIVSLSLQQLNKSINFLFSLTKVQRKIYEANLALQYFVTNDWIFKNENFAALNDQMRLEDVKSFGYKECFEYDVILFLRYAMLGVKRYLLGDKEENLPRNRVIYKRLKLLDRFVKLLPYAFAFYFIFVRHDLVHVCKSYFSG